MKVLLQITIFFSHVCLYFETFAFCLPHLTLFCTFFFHLYFEIVCTYPSLLCFDSWTFSSSLVHASQTPAPSHCPRTRVSSSSFLFLLSSSSSSAAPPCPELVWPSPPPPAD